MKCLSQKSRGFWDEIVPSSSATHLPAPLRGGILPSKLESGRILGGKGKVRKADQGGLEPSTSRFGIGCSTS